MMSYLEGDSLLKDIQKSLGNEDEDDVMIDCSDIELENGMPPASKDISAVKNSNSS
jgi:hypothetical protein